jgi:hypothetical protein
VIDHRHIQSLRQVIHQLFIIRIGVIKLEQGTAFVERYEKSGKPFRDTSAGFFGPKEYIF